MRIITGTARGTRLETLEGEATRPTAERVKEAVFSMIQFDLCDTMVLDLFSGSGQMGLEALSRGAQKAHMIDKSEEAVNVIKKNAQKCHLFDRCRIVTSDYLDFIRSANGKYKYDFIFLDPPYGSGMMGKALEAVAGADILNKDAWLICEDETEDLFAHKPEIAELYTVEKQNRYGRVYITVLSKKTVGGENA